MQKLKLVLLIIGISLLLFLGYSLSLYHTGSNAFNVDSALIEFKLPKSAKTEKTDEIKRLQDELSKTSDPLLQSPLEAQLANLYVAEAKNTAQLRFYDEAEATALSSLKKSPGGIPATMALSKVLSARHEFSKALALLAELPVKSKNAEEILYLTAVNQIALGEFDLALQSVNSLIRVSPNLSSATLKALVFDHLGQDDLAFYYFKRALQLEDVGESTQAILTRGQFATFLIKKGNYHDAIKLCDAALKISPDNAYNKLVKAQALNSLKRYSEAYELLTESFSQAREPIYLLNMVYSLRLLNREADFATLSKEAIQIYENEIKKNPYGHLLDLASLYYVTSDFEKAIKTVQLDQQNRTGLRGNLILAKSLIQLGKNLEARELIEKQISAGSTDVVLFLLMLKLQTDNNELQTLYFQRSKLNNANYNAELLLALP